MNLAFAGAMVRVCWAVDVQQPPAARRCLMPCWMLPECAHG
jgi:hypothetical protein